MTATDRKMVYFFQNKSTEYSNILVYIHIGVGSYKNSLGISKIKSNIILSGLLQQHQCEIK